MNKKPSSRYLLVAAVVAGSMILSGCGRLGAMSRVDPRSVAVYPGGRHNADPNNRTGNSNCLLVQGVGSRSRGAIDLDCFAFPEDTELVASGREHLAYSRAVDSPRERNRLTALLLKHSDDICVEEMGRLTANEATVNTSLNILATAATTAANIVTGEQAQSILTGVGTLAGASRSHVNADVYRNTVSYAISRAIVLERQRLRELIEARYGQNNSEFTVDDAIRSANQYHGVCSFYRGLELVLASVEGDQRSRAAQERRAQIQELEEQIRRYREQMATAADPKPYTDAIAALVARIQALALAAVPLPPIENSNRQDPQQPPAGAQRPAGGQPPAGGPATVRQPS